VYNHTNLSYLRNNVKRMKFGNYLSVWKLFNSDWEAMSRNFIDHLHSISETQNAEFYFHLWGHSWEISQYALWKPLEHFFKSINGISDIAFVNNSFLAEVVRQREQNVAVGVY
ncbi:MAG TPA: hypothetical protein VIM79_08480, partial [Niastella sp.]